MSTHSYRGSSRHSTLKIPAFCQAMSFSVFPSTETWSMPSAVMPVTTGLGTMFVLSNRPPTPTSRTVASTYTMLVQTVARRARRGLP